MNSEAEAAQMTAQLEAEHELAAVEAISSVVARWINSPDGKRQIRAATEPAQAEVRSRWQQILSLEEAYNHDS